MNEYPAVDEVGCLSSSNICVLSSRMSIDTVINTHINQALVIKRISIS